jgi:hypothetical protein
MSDQQNKPKTPMADMSESEIAMRKFLKALGVTTHQKLEAVLAEAVASGDMKSGDALEINATINIPTLDFSHDVSATLIAPDQE